MSERDELIKQDSPDEGKLQQLNRDIRCILLNFGTWHDVSNSVIYKFPIVIFYIVPIRAQGRKGKETIKLLMLLFLWFT